MRKLPLKSRIDEAVKAVEDAQRLPAAHHFLDTAILVLKDMKMNLNGDIETRGRIAGGFMRILMDDLKFADSPLGEMLIGIANDFA